MTSNETPSIHPGQLYEKYGNLLYRTAYALTLSKPDAEDVVQETFVKVLRKQPRFEDEEHEKAWLLRVTLNGGKDLLRRRKIRSMLPLEEALTISVEEVQSPLLEEIFALPPKYRMPLLLHYFEDLPIKKVGLILKLSESAVKMRLSRGRDTLKTQLERSDGHEPK